MAITNEDKVQEAYIAYYGRPADPGGLTHWVGQLDTGITFDVMLQAFGTSDEAVTLFGNKTPEETIQTLFQQILGRTPDAGGLAFYVGKLKDGSMTGITIAQNVFDGATDDDATMVANKLAVAKAFNESLNTTEKKAAYAGAAAVVTLRDMLATVDETTDPTLFDVDISIQGLVSAAAVAAFEAAAVNFDVTAATYSAAFITAAASKKAAAEATWTEVLSSAVDGYQVNIDYEGKIDGVAFDGGLAKGYDLVLGSNTMISGFEEGIVGMASGQEKDITVTFPENYRNTELAGKEAVFTINANTVSKVIVTDVALLTASQAAAAIAVTDAQAVSTAAIAASNAAAVLTTLSAVTSSVVDDATAATAVSQTTAVTASAATAATAAAAVKTTADNALAAAFAIAEPIKTAAFDASFVDYTALAVAFNAASATAAASKAAAETAATTVTDVALSTAFQTAAAIAVTDATAVSVAAIAASNAAAVLTTLSAATSSVVDDATAAARVSQTAAVTASAATAAAAAAAVKTTADNALAAAFAIAEPIKTAAFDASFVDYTALAVAFNAASATAAASKAAAETAATTVTDVALSTAFQTAAAIAVTDATAVSVAAIAASNAAAVLTTLSAATSSVVDDATAAARVSQTAAVTASAATAAAAAAAVKTTADDALAAATASTGLTAVISGGTLADSTIVTDVSITTSMTNISDLGDGAYSLIALAANSNSFKTIDLSALLVYETSSIAGGAEIDYVTIASIVDIVGIENTGTLMAADFGIIT